MNLFIYMYCLLPACNQEIQHLIYFIFKLAIVVRKKRDFGLVNLTVAPRVGSDDLRYGPGSGFSLKPVQTSSECMVCSAPYSERCSRVRLS